MADIVSRIEKEDADELKYVLKDGLKPGLVRAAEQRLGDVWLNYWRAPFLNELRQLDVLKEHIDRELRELDRG